MAEEAPTQSPVAATAADIAAFLFDMMPKEPGKRLDYHHALRVVRRQFGDDFTYCNRNGNHAIKQSVYAQFKLLHKGRAVWHMHNFYWMWDESAAEQAPAGIEG